MGRPVQHLEADLSEAYLSAVSAAAGLSCIVQSKHDYGVDASVKSVKKFKGEYFAEGELFDIQLKATTVWAKPSKTHIKYPLTASAYRRLKATLSFSRRLLVVLFLPEVRNGWVDCDHSALSLRKAAYWIDSKNLPKPRGKDSGVTVSIPLKNLMTPASLKKYADEVRAERVKSGLSQRNGSKP